MNFVHVCQRVSCGSLQQHMENYAILSLTHKMTEGCFCKALTLLAFFYVYKAKFDNDLARVKFNDLDEIFNRCGLFCSGGYILNGSGAVLAINGGERPRPYGPKRVRSTMMMGDKLTYN